MQLRPLRLGVYLFRSYRMVRRGYLKGLPIPELAGLAGKLIRSSWKVSGYRQEPFPSLFPK